MEGKEGFYTLKGYQSHTPEALTSSMEDYLEMICRMRKSSGVVRVHELAEKLHVKASSASKMVGMLRAGGYLDFPKYGYLSVTPKGLEAGEYLLYRHEVLSRFLCQINHSQQELEQVEKIEHFLNRGTIENLECLTRELEQQSTRENSAQNGN